MIKLKLTLLLAIAVFFGSQAIAQSVEVTIWPTPKHTLSPKTDIFCADSTLKVYTADTIGFTFNYRTSDYHIKWTILSSSGLAAGNIVGQSTDTSAISVMWAAVTTQQTGKIAFESWSNHDCKFFDTITVTINPAPTMPILAFTRTACVANQVDIIKAFIDTTGLTNYTGNIADVRSDVRFYKDAACTLPMNTISNGYYTPTSVGDTNIYARIEGHVSCFSKAYHFQLNVNPVPTIANSGISRTICDSTIKNLNSFITVTGADSVVYSYNSDFSTVIAQGLLAANVEYRVDIKNLLQKDTTIYVRVINRAIDMSCITEGTIMLTVNPAITNVRLAVLDASGTIQGANAEMCQEGAGSQAADGTITLTFRATMERGNGIFSDLKWLPGTATEAQTNPHTGASALDFTLPNQPADATPRTYKLTRATDSNGCIWTNPAP